MRPNSPILYATDIENTHGASQIMMHRGVQPLLLTDDVLKSNERNETNFNLEDFVAVVYRSLMYEKLIAPKRFPTSSFQQKNGFEF